MLYKHRRFATTLFLLLPFFIGILPSNAQSGCVTVRVTSKPAGIFIPVQALGAGVDGLNEGAVQDVYTPDNLKVMLSAGLRPLTYRLRTELGVEAWHWNTQGEWSGNRQGYWTSSAQHASRLTLCYGYKLPRRGNTIDQANNDGYSRIDDGDLRTFWKSNPYLDKYFTGENNVSHPQWVLINLGSKRPVNAIQIAWALPYALRYEVQYWTGAKESHDERSIDDTLGIGQWRTFPGGNVTCGKGGTPTLNLCKKPIWARYVRLWMTKGGGGPSATSDIRDHLGTAICEIQLGTRSRDGGLHDWVCHRPSGTRQTVVFTSSTDPWHRAADRDPHVEQPGFDRVFHSGLTNRLPVLMPAGMLYDTPNNAVAELKFLRARGYPVSQMELGEEPDGQYCFPEDYGALYLQWADALHRVDPLLKLGGPSFQTAINGWVTWPDANGDRSWLRRFLRYLKSRGHSSDFTFFSFEWYPFDNVCAPPAPQLALEPRLLENSLARLQSEGLSSHIPWIITEYGYSAFAGQSEMEMPGGLLNAEIAAQFLSLGGTSAYLYGYEPDEPIREKDGCDTWGNLTLLLSKSHRQSLRPLPTFYAAQLLTQQWAILGSSAPHAAYRATSNIHNRLGLPLVTAYALHRPDGQWSVLLLNKDPKGEHKVSLCFSTPKSKAITFQPGADLYQYGPAQYQWHPNKALGFTSPNLPPVHSRLGGSVVTLPAYSISVIRGLVLLNFKAESVKWW